MSRITSPDRRRVLRATGTALAGAMASVAGCVGGEETESTDTDTGSTDTDNGSSDADAASTDTEPSDAGTGSGSPTESTNQIALEARADGWIGRTPVEIENLKNPTLEVTAGQTYEITWENVDGEEHELIIESDDGTELHASKSEDTTGELVELTVDASTEMAGYYCEYHPDTMRGEIDVTDE